MRALIRYPPRLHSLTHLLTLTHTQQGTGKPHLQPAKKGLRGTLSTLIDSATSTERVHEILSDLLPEESYYRINPIGPAFACELDETDEGKLAIMADVARQYVEEHIEDIKQLCARLVDGL